MFRLEKEIFCRGTPPPPLVKGKFFDTRFGLIHVQTGKKNFCQGTPPPPLVKGKFFDTRFGLIHVQTGKKKFGQGTPHPPPPPPEYQGLAMATRRAVCLLRSRRRTFLFNINLENFQKPSSSHALHGNYLKRSICTGARINIVACRAVFRKYRR